MTWGARVVAVALVLPLVPLFVLAVAVPALSLAGHDRFWVTQPLTLPEAAALKDDAEVLWAIRRGVDPNARALVRAGVISDRERLLTPAEAAVASRRVQMLHFLVQQGARMDADTRRSLLCFARRVEAGEIVEYLELEPGAAQVSCEGVALPW